MGHSATRLADGFTVDLASRHGNPCRIQGGLAVGYSDSVVELRASNGALRRAVRLDTSCDPVQSLRRFEDVLAVVAWNGLEPDVTLHTLTAEGEVAAPVATLRGDSQAALRLALPGGVVEFSYDRPLWVALRGEGGWTVSLKTLPLRLDTRATYLNEQ